MRIAGLVLSGGKSSRMGVPKAFLSIDGESLLARGVRVLSEVLDPVAVSAAADQELPNVPAGIEIIRDGVQDCGPLAGIVAGMRHLRSVVEAVFILACDMPAMTSECVKAIVQTWEPGRDALVPIVNDRKQPLAAIYHTGILEIASERLAKHQLSLIDLIETLNAQYLEGLPGECFANVNTPAEWAFHAR